MSTELKLPRLLTAKQVAEMLTIPLYTLYDMVRENEGPPHLRIRRQIRFPEDGVVKWIHEQISRRE